MPPSRRSADPRLTLPGIWQGRGLWACLLLPFALVFAALSRLRRALYRLGWLHVERLPVPVVIIGNLTAGGAGKTPLVLYLADALRARGYRPGIVSRGYGGRATQPELVAPDSPASQVGDESRLLAQRSGVPVAVGRQRAAAARLLLARNPDCDVILADDGLQHYALARDIELAVFDRRGAMNGLPLPAGPLREPLSRLAEVDAVVASGEPALPALSVPYFEMRLHGDHFHRLGAPDATCGPGDFVGLRLHACAGIGDPQRFFDHLTTLGLDIVPHAFGDHHSYTPDDLNFAGDAVLTTEKDAVKLIDLPLALPVWVLPVTASLHPDLADFLLEKLNGRAPA